MSTRARLALFVILGAHVSLTVWLSAVLSIRVDEAYSLHTTSMGLAYAAREALVWEVQPPLYFVSLEMWRHIDGSLFFARLLSVLVVAIGVYVVGIVGSRYLSESHRLSMVAAAAFNPFVVASAVDARVYGFVFLWSALLMWLFFDGYISERRGLGPRLAFASVAIAALYTQYYLGFLLLSFGVALAAHRRWKDLVAFCGWLVPVVILFVPLVHFVRLEISTNVVNYFNNLDFFGNVALATSTLTHMTIPLDWAFQWSRYFLALVSIVLGFIVWRSDKASLIRRTFYPLVISVVAVLAFVSAVTVAHMPITPHYAAAFYVLTATLLFALISGLPGVVGNRVQVFASILLVTTSIASLISDYRVLAKPGDAARVAAFISAHESPHERIVVFDAQSALPLAYHYRGSNVIVPVPRPMRYDRYDLRDIAIRDEGDVRHALGYRAGSPNRVWLVSPPIDTCRRTPVNFRCELLYDFVALHYDTLIDLHYLDARVRLLRERR
jgi:hypothetical protein